MTISRANTALSGFVSVQGNCDKSKQAAVASGHRVAAGLPGISAGSSSNAAHRSVNLCSDPFRAAATV